MWHRTHSARFYKTYSHYRWSNPARRWIIQRIVLGVGVAFVLYIPVSYRLSTLLTPQDESCFATLETITLLELLPLNAISRWWGGVAASPALPPWIHQKLIQLYCWYTATSKADRARATEFETLQDFFVREDPPEARRFPLLGTTEGDEKGAASAWPFQLRAPCTGIVTQLGEVSAWENPNGFLKGNLVQAKGCTYRLEHLFRGGSADTCLPFPADEHGSTVPPPIEANKSKAAAALLRKDRQVSVARKRVFFAFYIRGKDNKHFFCPIDRWILHETNYSSGTLFPAASRGICRYIPQIFTGNERLGIIGRSPCTVESCTSCQNGVPSGKPAGQRKSEKQAWGGGLCAMSCIGGLCMGKIRLAFDERITTNIANPLEFTFRWRYTRRDGKGEARVPGSCCTLRQGDPVGHFEFGSAIILVADVPYDAQFAVRVGDVITAGAPLTA